MKRKNILIIVLAIVLALLIGVLIYAINKIENSDIEYNYNYNNYFGGQEYGEKSTY